VQLRVLISVVDSRRTASAGNELEGGSGRRGRAGDLKGGHNLEDGGAGGACRRGLNQSGLFDLDEDEGHQQAAIDGRWATGE
jgi:hypothetical protein